MSYEEKRESARKEAITWQLEAGNKNYSYEELANWHEHFEKLGHQYNLTEEFKENGII